MNLKVYCDFDPAAKSIYLGNLLTLIVLSCFHLHSHSVVAVVGGVTYRIGEPSSKSFEHPQLDLQTLETNTRSIKALISKILGNTHGPSAKDAILDVGSEKDSILIEILVNYNCWKGVTLLDFLKDVGRCARVGSMMAKESVKKRLSLEEGMSYTEFTYQLLQGYDFLHLFRNYVVDVQIGESDQWVEYNYRHRID